MSGMKASTPAQRAWERSSLRWAYSGDDRCRPAQGSKGSVAGRYAWSVWYPAGAASGSSVEGTETNTALSLASSFSSQDRMAMWWMPRSSGGGRPSERKPRWRCMKEGVAGALESNAEPGLRARRAAGSSSGTSLAASQVGMLSTTASLASNREPSASQTPVQRPPSTRTCLARALRSTRPPRFSTARTSVSAIAWEPPTG
mmetsp:Transcript_19732/g.66328  ORF Transcript_19732/g.66328 Transcript_19732/m.66328 type:complete len:201 (+) Transcript_19732:116-718(+)